MICMYICILMYVGLRGDRGYTGNQGNDCQNGSCNRYDSYITYLNVPRYTMMVRKIQSIAINLFA